LVDLSSGHGLRLLLLLVLASCAFSVKLLGNLDILLSALNDSLTQVRSVLV
jgi:hypothetical protein